MSDFESRLRGMTDESKRFGDTIHKSGLSLTKLFTTIAGSHHVMDIWRTAVKRSDFLTGVNSVFSVATKTTGELVQQQRVLSSSVNRLNAFIARGINMRGKSVAQAGDELRIKQAQLLVAQRQLALDTELRKIHVLEGAWYLTILSSVGSLWERHKEINRELIEANSSFETRYGLTKTILNTQIQLGSEYRDTVEAAQALVGYGYDLSSTLGDQVKLVMQMKDGMGVAVRTSAELVTVYDRQLKVSVREVADGIARVANDTGLAADEATRLAISIGRSVSMLRPGLARDVAAVNELIGRYEGSLHELGGQFGSFAELLTRMTTPEGMAQAGILGVNSPEFLASKDATKRVIDQFAQYARQTLGTSQGWDRALRLQTLSEQFGTTTQQINLMLMATERANAQQKSGITLQDRYNEQIRNSGQALSRLGHSLQALFQQAVTPLLKVITPVINGVASLVGGLLKIPGAVYVIAGAMILTIPLVVTRVYSLTTSFVLAAVAAHRLTSALREQALTSALAAGATPGRGGTARTVRDLLTQLHPRNMRASARRLVMNLRPLVSFFRMQMPLTMSGIMSMTVRSLVGALGSLLGAGALGYVIGTAMLKVREIIDRKYGAGSVKFTNTVLRESMEELTRRIMTSAALKGDMGQVHSAQDTYREYLKKKGNSDSDIEVRLARRIAELPTEVGKLRFAKEITHDTFYSEADQKNAEMLLYVQQRLLAESERQREAAMKGVDANKESNRLEREKAEEKKRERRIMRPPMMPIPTGY
jgi:hypothetical protein